MMSIATMAVVLLLSACGGKTGKSASDADSLQADSVTTETAETGVDKHTEAYLRERVDSFYFNYRNPRYEKNGMRIYNGKFVNRDSAYCSKSYQDLLAKAEEIAQENEEPLLDYDHWTNSQDDNNFTCEISKINNMTDSTAVVKLKAKNSGKPYTITLNMRFERNDWYVDDFISDDGIGEKTYFKEYIERNTFYQRFSLDDLLYLTEHYAESAKAEMSGLSFIYHDSQSDEDMDYDVYVYGRDVSRSTKKELGYNLISNTPHAFYFSMISIPLPTEAFISTTRLTPTISTREPSRPNRLPLKASISRLKKSRMVNPSSCKRCLKTSPPIRSLPSIVLLVMANTS